ncbi:poly(A) RNA polymerase GLD2-like [Clavelina lepadiformis]|uniref:poly(A) RNA polymerase GLD2-like n=1 Tax=Clavelina lepadiformis TaxID=159417 RepID=UPI0040436A28
MDKKSRKSIYIEHHGRYFHDYGPERNGRRSSQTNLHRCPLKRDVVYSVNGNMEYNLQHPRQVPESYFRNSRNDLRNIIARKAQNGQKPPLPINKRNSNFYGRKPLSTPGASEIVSNKRHNPVHKPSIRSGLKWNQPNHARLNTSAENEVIIISSDSDCEIVEFCQTSKSTASEAKQHVILNGKREHNMLKNKQSSPNCGVGVSSKCIPAKQSSNAKEQVLKRKISDNFKTSSLRPTASTDRNNKRRRLESSHPSQTTSQCQVLNHVLHADPLSQQIQKFLVDNEQRQAFLDEKIDLVTALEKTLSNTIFPEARVHLVGSSSNGFGRLTSDADMCLVLDGVTRVISRKPFSVLTKIQNLLRNVDFASNLQIIPAKVSILKFNVPHCGLECDINVDKTVGLRNTYLLLAYARRDPRVRPLVMCVKEWAHTNEINDASRGTFSSYALCLMVIHYLQCGPKPRVLPSLQVLYPQSFSFDLSLDEVKEFALKVPPFCSANKQPLSELLIGFFEYFSRFDFSQIMSVRLGKTLRLTEGHYTDKENPYSKKFFRIEEPFDLSNVARAVKMPKAPLLIRKFSQAVVRIAQEKDLRCLLRNATPQSHLPSGVCDNRYRVV